MGSSTLNRPTISVVIPTYNRCHSLKITLIGLSAQTYPRDLYEVIVVSDGCTDNTESVVKEYKSVNQNAVQYINQINSGPASARNRGVSAANNDIIVFLDDDVEPVPQFLERHASRHMQDDRLAVIGPMSSDSRRLNEPVWITWEHEKLLRVYKMFQKGGAYPDGVGGPMHFYSGNASIRKSWLVSSGGFDTRYKRQEDVELAERLAASLSIRFVFDFGADGIHRPVRTFKSWLRIPADYGRLDAQRLAEGTIDQKHLRGNFEDRHWLSKLVVGFVGLSSITAAVTEAILIRLTLMSAAMRIKKVSLLLLSALYNATYHRNFRAERNRLRTQKAKRIGPKGSAPTNTATL